MSELDYTIDYKASPTLEAFHNSNAFYRGILGPVGSGKSTGCCAEIMSRAMEQRPGLGGKRRSRWVVVRNTYRELEDTTLKTWLAWFPEEYFGAFNHSNMSHDVSFNDVELEVLFRALDRPQDVKKLLSLELTGGWVNEAKEVPKGIIDTLGDRVGRYPAVKDGGCRYRGVIMDTNPPDEDHWWYHLAEEERPDGWDFFRQPGGLVEVGGKFIANPEAENLANIEPNYYMTRMGGKSRGHILIYYCAQYGFIMEGKPVHPEYFDATHCAQDIIKPIPGRTIYIGIDFGLTPAAAIGQKLVSGRWNIIDELVTEHMGAKNFAGELGRKLAAEYKGFDFEFYGDPAGNQEAQTDEETPFRILQANGIPAVPAHTNDPELRREAVKSPLTRMVDGKPGFLLSPKCKTLRKGLSGGYHYRRLQVPGDERWQEKPNKNKYSHPCEALQYMFLGAGEGRQEMVSASKVNAAPLRRKPANWRAV